MANSVAVMLTSAVSAVGKRERPLLQPPEVEGEPVPLPGQDLQPVPPLVPEHEQVAAQWVAGQVGRDHGRPARRNSSGRLAAGRKSRSGRSARGLARPTPSAATRRATAAGSAPTGTRTSNPPGRTISIVGSGITRTAANDGLGTAGAAGRGIAPGRRVRAALRRRWLQRPRGRCRTPGWTGRTPSRR